MTHEVMEDMETIEGPHSPQLQVFPLIGDTCAVCQCGDIPEATSLGLSRASSILKTQWINLARSAVHQK